MRRLNVENLGDLEVATVTKLNRQEAHIEALERIVDELKEENRLLKDKLKVKPSIIAQEDYDDLCRRFQLECDKNIPF